MLVISELEQLLGMEVKPSLYLFKKETSRTRQHECYVSYLQKEIKKNSYVHHVSMLEIFLKLRRFQDKLARKNVPNVFILILKTNVVQNDRLNFMKFTCFIGTNATFLNFTEDQTKYKFREGTKYNQEILWKS